jgi:hypothetical protein
MGPPLVETTTRSVCAAGLAASLVASIALISLREVKSVLGLAPMAP